MDGNSLKYLFVFRFKRFRKESYRWEKNDEDICDTGFAITSFDEYSVIGNGVSSSDAGIAVSSSIVDALIDPATGVCGSGWIGATNNKSNVCYRGVWDLWGNYWQWRRLLFEWRYGKDVKRHNFGQHSQ